ncbi:hypothetical protein FA13DRAFT_1790683 [Coprinellus micaceus]|uniref:Swi5-domain-containing protein n=1 Tax=Coprinellus micaceus TaxID=71717 RepID=A0A4Y7TDW8_COPMI|nr:hypothetical protein FA13DRAFT_1790683 [Coprinellus micaceus]
MHASVSAKKQQEKVAELEAEVERLQLLLGDRDADAIVKNHIKLLHQYNEVKDATQILIGRLAAWTETTIRQVHKDYDLEDED